MSESTKIPNKLPNKTYCPNCVKNQYKDDEDACYDFEVWMSVKDPKLMEVRCKRCGFGAVYFREFLED